MKYMERKMHVFTSQELQRNVGQVQEAALSEPVVVTHHGRPRLVVMSMAEYDRLRGRRRMMGGVDDLPDEVTEQLDALSLLAEQDDVEAVD